MVYLARALVVSNKSAGTGWSYRCNIFEDTKALILKLLHLIYCFAHQVDWLKLLPHETRHNFALRTRAYYIEVLRRLVCDDLLEHKKPIGSPGLTNSDR